MTLVSHNSHGSRGSLTKQLTYHQQVNRAAKEMARRGVRRGQAWQRRADAQQEGSDQLLASSARLNVSFRGGDRKRNTQQRKLKPMAVGKVNARTQEEVALEMCLAFSESGWKSCPG